MHWFMGHCLASSLPDMLLGGERRAYAIVPLQVEYKFTPLGLELLKLCGILSNWAEEHGNEIERAQKAYNQRIKGKTPLS
jgi:DNA-binding HxlR family transcriptional regulator